ncbi:hypothetical protein G7Y89_g10975 [Cudoniella acicularis]|uniref:Uncharacterized protein n=1 Tax=Cudoniella acicularis TaxID=354080 RepID=A0A8H4RD85_9HELO|nr:hypothetical protein G7Y89_g10975 [Cudoniella acicularis]
MSSQFVHHVPIKRQDAHRAPRTRLRTFFRMGKGVKRPHDDQGESLTHGEEDARIGAQRAQEAHDKDKQGSQYSQNNSGHAPATQALYAQGPTAANAQNKQQTVTSNLNQSPQRTSGAGSHQWAPPQGANAQNIPPIATPIANQYTTLSSNIGNIHSAANPGVNAPYKQLRPNPNDNTPKPSNIVKKDLPATLGANGQNKSRTNKINPNQDPQRPSTAQKRNLQPAAGGKSDKKPSNASSVSVPPQPRTNPSSQADDTLPDGKNQEVKGDRLPVLPELKDSGDISIPSREGEDLHENDTETNTDEDDSAKVLERMYRRLQQLKFEFSSIPFGKELTGPRPGSPSDVEKALSIFISAHETTFWKMREFEESVKQLRTKNDNLQTESKEILAQNSKEFEGRISTLEKERDRSIWFKDGIIDTKNGIITAKEKEIAEWEKKLEKQVKQVEAEHESSRKALVEIHEIETQELRGQVSSLESQHAVDLANLIDEHSTKTSLAKSAADEAERELGSQLSDVRILLKETTVTFELRLDTMKRNHDDEVKRKEDELAKKVEELNKKLFQHKDRLNDEYEDHKQKTERYWRGLNEELGQRNNQLVVDHETHIRNLEDHYQGLNEELRRQMNQLVADNETEKEDLEKHWKGLNERLLRQKNQLAMDYQKQTKAAEERFQSQLKDAQGQLNQERVNRANDIASKEEEIKTIKQQHESEKSTMEKEYDLKYQKIVWDLRNKVEELKGRLVARDTFKVMSDHELSASFEDISTEVDQIARILWDKKHESSWPFRNLKSFNNPEIERVTKQNLIQNTIWVILFEKIFFTPFRVLGENGRTLERDWIKKHHGPDHNSTGSRAACPRPTKASETWRYEEIKKCAEAIGQSLTERDAYFNVKQDYESSLADVIDDILHELRRVAPVNIREEQRVGDLVKNAGKLWLDVGQQRFRVYLLMSKSNDPPVRSRPDFLDDGTLHLVLVPELRRIVYQQGEKYLMGVLKMRIPFRGRHKSGNPSISSTISTPSSSTTTVPPPYVQLPPGDLPTPVTPEYKVSPAEIRELNELIRKRYALDIEIWEVGRLCKPRNQPQVEEIMARSDAALLKILTIVRAWDNPQVWKSQEDWIRIRNIRARLEKDPETKINWAATKPWNMK